MRPNPIHPNGAADADHHTIERFGRQVWLGGDGDCWPWMAAINKGYGSFGITRNRMVSAHKFSYELLVGPVPRGLELDHLCHNRVCVNPFHLEPVTQRVNLLRGESLPAVNARKTIAICGHPLQPLGGTRGCPACVSAYRKKYSANYYREVSKKKGKLA